MNLLPALVVLCIVLVLLVVIRQHTELWEMIMEMRLDVIELHVDLFKQHRTQTGTSGTTGGTTEVVSLEQTGVNTASVEGK